MKKVLWWGHFDPEYSRNRVNILLFKELGWIVDFFFVKLWPRFGDIEAFFRKLDKRSKPDLVWVPVTRQRDVLAACRWAHKRGIPVVFDPLISAWDKQVFEKKKYAPGSFLANRLLKWERRVFSECDIICADTICHADFFENALKVDRNRLRVLPLSTDESLFKEDLGKLPHKNEFKVLYYGKYHPLHGTDAIVEAARETETLGIKWTMLGEGGNREKAEEKAKGLTNIEFLNNVPYSELPDIIREHDVSLGVFGKTQKAARVVANKVCEALACGRPIVNVKSDAYPKESNNCRAIKFVSPGDGKAIAKAIIEYKADWANREDYFSAARDFFKCHFSNDIIKSSFRKMVDEVTAPKKISVIVPVYNVEKYLARALDSVLAQTYPYWEAICVNDGSTDRSGKILEEYQDRDPRFKLVYQENKGLGATRNRALAEVTGDYVIFLDSDDILHPQALEFLLRSAQKTMSSISLSTSFLKLSKKPKLRKHKFESLRCRKHKHAVRDMLKKKNISGSVCNKLYRRELFDDFKFIEGIKYEDWPLSTCMFSKIQSFASLNIPLYFYDDTTVSIVRSSFAEKKIKDYFTGIRFVYDFYQQPEKLRYWPLVRRYRIRQSLKMILSKIAKTSYDKKLSGCFYESFRSFVSSGIIAYGDLSLKSKIRFLRIIRSMRNI